ncbi:MAG: bifunctional phosphoglucose/phosphomannose isomerase [Candidatus Krumholzibacteriota bacterium]|nr:bifunctional phosphoglucose/phosphomannose isomerase [Candidatus Krumholzibacteriota bacterium]
MGTEGADRFHHIDRSRMLETVVAGPGQLIEGWRAAADAAGLLSSRRTPMAICGMGGSAAGGLLLGDLAGAGAPAPVHVIRNYLLPSWVGEDTLLVCVSYSGDTEETLECFHNALLRGNRPVAITSGGRLAEEARRAGTPLVTIPGGLPPRAAIGYLFGPLLRLGAAHGLVDVDDETVARAVHRAGKIASRYALEADLAGNVALQLAKKLYGRIPLVYSGGGLLANLPYRWKCQFNENSKSMAFANVFPELGHNEVMGWESTERMREGFFLVMLRDAADHPRVQRRMDATYAMLEPLGAGATLLDSEGPPGRAGRLERLLSLLVLGDVASVYLAVEYGKDPTPIDKIQEIKDLLGTEDR